MNFFIFQGQLFLVKWDGYQEHECTWEPKSHLPVDLIRDFYSPDVSEECIKIYSASLESSFRQRLKTGKDTFSLLFPNSLFRYAFNTSTEKLVEREDFNKLSLSEHWDTVYRSNGVGVSVKFPVRITPVLTFVNNFVPVNGGVENRKYPVEKIRVVSATTVTFA